MKKCIALIPARSGSVRIRNKNLLQISGYPLLAIAVQQALMIPEIDEVYVSTDSELYAEVASNYGAGVPFLRPADISTSTSTDYDVFEHFLKWYSAEKKRLPDLVVQIRATAPNRDLDLVGEAIKIMDGDRSFDSLRSVSTPHQSPYKMWVCSLNHQILPLLSDFKGYDGPTQSLPKAYGQDGVVDVIRPSTILEKHSMSGDRIAGIINPNENWDIDNLYDLKNASALFKNSNLFGMLHGTEFGGNLGIIQGRLTESEELQKFPSNWEKEFESARKCGYHCIELIRDITYNPINPLYSDDLSSVSSIKAAAEKNGVAVRSICDDYVQSCDWNSITVEQYNNLISLLIKANMLDISTVVYPMFQKAALDNEASIKSFTNVLSALAPLARQFNIRIALEITSDIKTLRKVFAEIPWQNIGLCLDTGNLWNSGYNAADIIRDAEIGKRIVHLHLKDRDKDGKNVVPGVGGVDFEDILSQLIKIGYDKLLITETDRGVSPIQTAKKNREYFSDIIRRIGKVR